MSLKIIIVHMGYKPYLETNIQITSKTNKIVLIGDDSVAHLAKYPNVEFFNVNRYINDEKIVYYKKYFKNYSSYVFNWIWTAGPLRMFLIHKYLIEHNVKHIFNIDSDNVMLYDINNYVFNKENAYIMCQNYNNPNHMAHSIHAALISQNMCIEFEKLYEDLYINESKLHLIENKINFHKNEHGGYRAGGICEMTMCYVLSNEKIIEVQNLLEPSVGKDGETYVFNKIISSGEGAVSKSPYHNNIIAYTIFDNINKKNYNLMSIHFQGGSKQLLNNELLNKLEETKVSPLH